LKAHVILNPASARGQSLRQWPRLEQILRGQGLELVLHKTTAPGDGMNQARQALQAGAQWVIAVGGDGTLNEVVNGFFDQAGQPLAPESYLSVLMCGTGGDFARTLKQPRNLEQAALQLLAAEARRIDLGRVRLTAPQGQQIQRQFINIASFGLGGEVSARLNQSQLLARLHGKLAFFLSTLETLASFQSQAVRLTLTHQGQPFSLTTRIQQVAVANGCFQGGGMHVAPQAQLDDGLFEVVILEDLGLWSSLNNFIKVYRGAHLQDPRIRCFQTASLEVEPLDGAQVKLELDGETPGHLPARFDILPRAIWLKG